ncbi:MAG: glycyl-radical enzyme activating protein, partial [Candidatus Ornithomonoglobus sp.]
IRVPVIPTFNNTPEEISDIADFAASLPGVKQLHLLPYHRLGQGKYDGLGREYTMRGIEPMTHDYMDMLLEVAKRSGLECQIGG